MDKIGRNDPCHCGSGKKYKNCHEKTTGAKKNGNKGLIIGGVIGVLLILAAIAITINSSTPKGGAPGPAPEGKVWSEAHGHWHDL
jgi:hypothetical protein